MSDLVIVALIAAAPPTLAVVVSHFKQQKRIQEVHVLVNARLQVALEEIERLKAALFKRDPAE